MAHVGLLGPAAGVNKVVGRKQNLSDEDLNKTRNGVGLTEVMKTWMRHEIEYEFT